jgi:hypothetical protein
MVVGEVVLGDLVWAGIGMHSGRHPKPSGKQPSKRSTTQPYDRRG